MEIKNCPFCGSAAKLYKRGSEDGLNYVSCVLCGCSTRLGNADNVTETWNRRVSVKRSNKCSSGTNQKEANELFEELWRMYPRKEGKCAVSDKKKRDLLGYKKEDLEKAIQTYSGIVESAERQYILQGGTFFNGRFKDYLPGVYQGENKRVEEW